MLLFCQSSSVLTRIGPSTVIMCICLFNQRNEKENKITFSICITTPVIINVVFNTRLSYFSDVCHLERPDTDLHLRGTLLCNSVPAQVHKIAHYHRQRRQCHLVALYWHRRAPACRSPAL